MVTMIYRVARLYCKKGNLKLRLFRLNWLSQFLLIVYIVNSEIPWPALDSTQVKNLIWPSRTLVNVMGEYFANEIGQSCEKGVKLMSPK